MKLFHLPLLGLALVLAPGCASTLSDPSGKHNALENAQRRYTELVRWGELERASAFVDPELLEEYLGYATALEDIRFTDFETGSLVFHDETDTATAVVVYHAYSLSTLVEKRIREDQQWYRDDKLSNSWRVRPDMRQIVAGVTGSR